LKTLLSRSTVVLMCRLCMCLSVCHCFHILPHALSTSCWLTMPLLRLEAVFRHKEGRKHKTLNSISSTTHKNKTVVK
jgi:hypothetical protein